MVDAVIKERLTEEIPPIGMDDVPKPTYEELTQVVIYALQKAMIASALTNVLLDVLKEAGLKYNQRGYEDALMYELKEELSDISSESPYLADLALSAYQGAEEQLRDHSESEAAGSSPAF